jgi:hypothetical protein
MIAINHPVISHSKISGLFPVLTNLKNMVEGKKRGI